MNHKILALLLFVPLVASQTSCSSTKKKVKTALKVADMAERVAKGDESQLIPLIVTVLNEGQGYAVVHQEGHAVVAEVTRIPGLGLKIPRSGNKRYYLRFDLQDLGETTKMVLNFFRSEKGSYVKREKPDNVIARGAAELFAAIFGALLKSGVVFVT